MGINYLGEMVSLLFVALALGMDAFSVSLALGMQEIRLKRMAFIGIVIGLFHIILPFLGIIIGQFLSSQVSHLTTLVSAILLVVIGANMFFSAFHLDMKKISSPYGFGFVLLAMTVSVDSFSVGLSLGLSGVKVAIAIILFGVTSMCLTWIGLLLGRNVQGFLGAYSEMFGGSILIAFGLLIIFG